MARILSCKFDKNEIIVYGRARRGINIILDDVKESEEEKKRVKKDEIIIVDASLVKTHNAQFYIDESCFEDNQIPESVKWSVVYQKAFAYAHAKNRDVPSELWALNEGDINMVNEGAMTSVQYYNEDEADNALKSDSSNDIGKEDK